MQIRSLPVVAALLLVAGGAEAHRGVDRGDSCKSLVEVESELGSRLFMSGPGQEPGSVNVHFFGEALGHPVTITYICVAELVAMQMISATFHERRPAEAFFEQQVRALSVELGPPAAILGAADIEGIREMAGISADRMALWESSPQPVTLVLTSGEHQPWKILLSGP